MKLIKRNSESKYYEYSIEFDLVNSNIIVRRQFTGLTITNRKTSTVTAGDNETFLPYDEERYVLIRTGNGVDDFGGTEALSADKINFNDPEVVKNRISF